MAITVVGENWISVACILPTPWIKIRCLFLLEPLIAIKKDIIHFTLQFINLCSIFVTQCSNTNLYFYECESNKPSSWTLFIQTRDAKEMRGNTTYCLTQTMQAEFMGVNTHCLHLLHFKFQNKYIHIASIRESGSKCEWRNLSFLYSLVQIWAALKTCLLERGQPLIPYEHGSTSALGYRLISSCLSTAR